MHDSYSPKKIEKAVLLLDIRKIEAVFFVNLRETTKNVVFIINRVKKMKIDFLV